MKIVFAQCVHSASVFFVIIELTRRAYIDITTLRGPPLSRKFPL